MSQSGCDDCPTFPLNGGPDGTCVPPAVQGPICVVPIVVGATISPENPVVSPPQTVYLQGRCAAGVLTMGYYNGPLAGAVLVGPVSAFRQVKCPQFITASIAQGAGVPAPATTCGADGTVNAVSNLSQQVHTAPGTALLVKLCATTSTSRSVITACNAAGQTIIVQYDTSTVPPTELSRWNGFTNTAAPAGPLVTCAGPVPTLETDTVCAAGVQRERVRVFSAAGALVSTVFYDESGGVIPTPPAFTPGLCLVAPLCRTCRLT